MTKKVKKLSGVGQVQKWIDENQILDLVSDALANKAITVVSWRMTRQHGISMEARGLHDLHYHIYAEGESSTHLKSKFYGKPFDTDEIYNRVAKATYAVLATYGNSNSMKTGLAFPDVPTYRRYVDKITPLLNKLNIGIMWVTEDGVKNPDGLLF